MPTFTMTSPVWRKQSGFAKPNIPPRPHVRITVSRHMSIVQSVTLNPINKQHLTALCLLVRVRTVHYSYSIVLVRRLVNYSIIVYIFNSGPVLPSF